MQYTFWPALGQICQLRSSSTVRNLPELVGSASLRAHFVALRSRMFDLRGCRGQKFQVEFVAIYTSRRVSTELKLSNIHTSAKTALKISYHMPRTTPWCHPAHLIIPTTPVSLINDHHGGTGGWPHISTSALRASGYMAPSNKSHTSQVPHLTVLTTLLVPRVRERRSRGSSHRTPTTPQEEEVKCGSE